MATYSLHTPCQLKHTDNLVIISDSLPSSRKPSPTTKDSHGNNASRIICPYISLPFMQYYTLGHNYRGILAPPWPSIIYGNLATLLIAHTLQPFLCILFTSFTHTKRGHFLSFALCISLLNIFFINLSSSIFCMSIPYHGAPLDPL